VKRLMLDHAFNFVDTVVFWVGEKNFRSQGAMTKIDGIKRAGIFERPVSDGTPYIVFEITKERYHNGGRALVA
jgi:RimJ/RimL family protein N-acetyltransferase